jgi:hypothetical protein
MEQVPDTTGKSIMSNTTLRTLTLETVANYRQVAEHAVGAYRASGHRLIAMVRRSVDRGTRRMAPQLVDVVRQTSARVSEVATKGIDGVTAQTERVIERSAAGVNARVERIADLARDIDNRYVATGLQTAARFSLTGAQAALAVSEKLAAGADRLAEVVGGKRARGTQAVARAKTAVKAARRATAPAGPRARKAVEPRVAKAVEAVTKRARATPAKPVARPVVKAKAPRRAARKAQPQPTAAA